MIAAAHLLALWLSPALWLRLPTFIVDEGPTGLWVCLAAVVVPLLALSVRRPEAPHHPLADEFSATALLLVAALLVWGNLALAGDLADQLGAARWQGVAIAAIAAALFSVPLHARVLVPGLLVLAAIALAVSLGAFAREAGIGPLAAWERVAGQSAFRFPATSVWVTAGGDLALARVRGPLAFDEEHRVTAVSGGVLRMRWIEAGRAWEHEWALAPGQTVTFRPGDELLLPAPAPLRFEAGKRIPGSPPSGTAWANGRGVDWPRALDLHLTLLLGGLAILAMRPAGPVPRGRVWLIGGALVATALWAQGWAVYGLLSTPDVLLGGVTAERLAALGALSLDRIAGEDLLGGLVLAAALLSFVASSIALRGRIVAAGPTRGAGHAALWVGVFAVGASLSAWPADPWRLVTAAFGTAAAALGPAVLWPPATAGGGVAAGAAGLVAFAGLAGAAALRQVAPDLVRVDRPAWLASAWELGLQHPVPTSVLAGFAVLCVASLAARR